MMLLGSGELAKELAISFQRLGAEVIVVDAGKGGPAQGVADRAVLAPIGESERLYDLIEKERPRFVLPLVEAASREALDKLAEGEVTQVIPTAKAVRLAGDREGMRRMAAEELGLPTPATGLPTRSKSYARCWRRRGSRRWCARWRRRTAKGSPWCCATVTSRRPGNRPSLPISAAASG